jgi:hypothetical protein
VTLSPRLVSRFGTLPIYSSEAPRPVEAARIWTAPGAAIPKLESKDAAMDPELEAQLLRSAISPGGDE